MDTNKWEIGVTALDISHIEPDFPEWFYVRKETQDIINIYNNLMEQNLSIVFVGTPGVGKSTLVVLFAFYMALQQQKRVILFRTLPMRPYSMLNLDGRDKKYWRMNRASVSDLDQVLDQDFELCLDGFTDSDISENYATLGSFKLLTTPVQYPMKDSHIPVLRECLVPFWSKSDLNKIGGAMSWTEHDINERYYYSGGSLRDFLAGKDHTMIVIQQALAAVRPYTAELLSTRHRSVSVSQINRIRMTTIQSNGQTSDSMMYLGCHKWFCAITSQYVLRELGKIVTPSYYEEVLAKSRKLGDDVLMGIAFENYVHTMARDGHTLELQVREYDQKKTS